MSALPYIRIWHDTPGYICHISFIHIQTGSFGFVFLQNRLPWHIMYWCLNCRNQSVQLDYTNLLAIWRNNMGIKCSQFHGRSIKYANLLETHFFKKSKSHIGILCNNKKAQLSLTNPRDAKACQNCSNSMCLQRCRWQYWPIFMRLTAIASEICEIPRNLLKIQTHGVQGHPRSSTLVPIESPYVTCY